MAAVHGSKVVEPISIHYNKKYGLVVVHAISIGKGMGWDMADVIQDLAKQLNAKEVISIEGVGSMQQNVGDSKVYYYTSKQKNGAALDKVALPLKEGIVVGVTGALMARGSNSTLPYTALFAETQSNLPDSKSSAAIIRALDKYLNLDVDPGPLLKQAQQFEGKLKGLLVQAKKTEELQNDKADYFG
jgi:predicted ATP-grasp superfamily ATP-dependent carboligase